MKEQTLTTGYSRCTDCRLIINCNSHGGQEVYHLHLHLVGGRPLGRMVPAG